MYRLISESIIQTNAISEIRVKSVKAGLLVTSIKLETTPVAHKMYEHLCRALNCVAPVDLSKNEIVLDFTKALNNKKVLFDGEETFRTYQKIED